MDFDGLIVCRIWIAYSTLRHFIYTIFVSIMAQSQENHTDHLTFFLTLFHLILRE